MIRALWYFWAAWCDEDAPVWPKRIGFVAGLAAYLAGIFIAGYRLMVGPLPVAWAMFIFVPFLILAGCAWQVGRRAWSFGYIGMVLIMGALIALARG